MEDFAIIILIIVIIILFLYKKQSSYTADQLNTLFFSIPLRPSISSTIIDIMINDLQGESSLKSANILIDQLNGIGANPPLVPYASDEDIKKMFKTAYQNSETGLTRTDKAILRAFSISSWGIMQLPWGEKGLPALEYTPDGTTVWTADMLKQTGLTIREAMQKVLESMKMFQGNSSASLRLETINSLLPSNVTPFASLTDYRTRITNMLFSEGSPTIDSAILWFVKFASIGPLYIAWVAENKWKLDPNGFQFLPPQEPVAPNGGEAVAIALSPKGESVSTGGMPSPTKG